VEKCIWCPPIPRQEDEAADAERERRRQQLEEELARKAKQKQPRARYEFPPTLKKAWDYAGRADADRATTVRLFEAYLAENPKSVFRGEIYFVLAIPLARLGSPGGRRHGRRAAARGATEHWQPFKPDPDVLST